MQYCRFYYNPYMKLPCIKDNYYRSENDDDEMLTRQNIDNRTEQILNNVKRDRNVDEYLQSFGISSEDTDAILTTIIRYTLEHTRVPVLPANIPAKTNNLVNNLSGDDPALLRFLQMSGLNHIQSRRVMGEVISYTLEAILPENL